MTTATFPTAIEHFSSDTCRQSGSHNNSKAAQLEAAPDHHCDDSPGKTTHAVCAAFDQSCRSTVRQLTEAIEAQRSRLMKVARGFFRCDSACEDAVQDAILAALQNVNSFRGDSTVSTWMHRILINTCLMKQRTLRRRRTESLESAAEPTDSRWPTDSVDSEEAGHRLRAALTCLTPAHRTVISLRCFEGFSTAEAAALLGIRQEALKTRLHRACAALRDILSASDAEIR